MINLLFCLSFVGICAYELDNSTLMVEDAYQLSLDDGGEILVDSCDNDILSKTYSLNGGKFSDIQKTIDKSKDGDTITLSGKFYAVDENSIIKINKKLTISSKNEATLDGKDISGIFALNQKAKGSTISNLKFINGYRFSASAIFIDAKNVKINKCTFENNVGSGNGGGAVATYWDKDRASGLTISDCTFKGNTAPASSGALAAFSTNFKIINCKFIENTASNKEGRTAYDGALQVGMMSGTYGLVSGCTFRNNYAKSGNLNEPSCGGAMCIRKGTVVENCVFENNYADEGGAIYFYSSGTVKNCRFIKNNALSGGALKSEGKKVEIYNSDFEFNSANEGGAVFLSDSQLNIYDSHFYNNTADVYGGAVLLSGDNNIISTSDFKGNNAKYGGGLYLEGKNTKINDAVFESNTANIAGGAINIDADDIELSDSEFSFNQAITGGAVNVLGSNILLSYVELYNNSALMGGALYNCVNSGLYVDNNKFYNNQALNGSAIYNNWFSDILNSDFSNNKAKSYILTANNISVKKYDLLLIECYYECGDNLLDAIYDNGTISINNESISKNSGCKNQKIHLMVNNITYSTFTDDDGLASFKISTDNFEVGNYTYLVGHEEDELYSEIFNSSVVEILYNEEYKNDDNSDVKDNNKKKDDNSNVKKDNNKKHEEDNKNNIISSENKKLTPVSSSSFLKNIEKGVYKKEYSPIKKETYENCGAKVLRELLASKGIYVDLNVLIGKLNSKNGQTSMYDIIRVAKEYGITVYANKMSLNDLKKGDIVLININGHNHFVTIYSVGEDYVIYNDPDLGYIKVSESKFSSEFSGYSISERIGDANIIDLLVLFLMCGYLPILLTLFADLSNKVGGWMSGSRNLNMQLFPEIYNFERHYNSIQERNNKKDSHSTMNYTYIPTTVGQTELLPNGSHRTNVSGHIILHSIQLTINKNKIGNFLSGGVISTKSINLTTNAKMTKKVIKSTNGQKIKKGLGVVKSGVGKGSKVIKVKKGLGVVKSGVGKGSKVIKVKKGLGVVKSGVAKTAKIIKKIKKK